MQQMNTLDPFSLKFIVNDMLYINFIQKFIDPAPIHCFDAANKYFKPIVSDIYFNDMLYLISSNTYRHCSNILF